MRLGVDPWPERVDGVRLNSSAAEPKAHVRPKIFEVRLTLSLQTSVPSMTYNYATF